MERAKRFFKVVFICGIILMVLLIFAMGFEEFFSDNSRFFACFFAGVIPGIVSLFIPTKAEKEEKIRIQRQRDEEERKRKEEAARRQEEEKQRAAEAARARNAPGCYSKDNVDLLTFGSHNNIFTAGNNAIRFKIRNRNSYDVLVSVRFKYSDGWDSSSQTYEVGGNQIRTVDTLGRAWRKATDVSIVNVY